MLAAVQKYARETGVAAATTRGARVTAVTECFTSTAEEPKKESGNGSAAQGSGGGFFVDYELDVSVAAREQAERLRIGKKKKKKEKEGKDGQEDEEKEVEEEEKGVVEKRRLRASTVIVATGTLGRPMTPEERGLPSTAPFKGAVCYACRHGEEEWNEKNSSSSSSKPSPLAEGAPAVAGKKVVILGSGAFALEAAERAAYCGAESITIVCRPHEQLRKDEFFLLFLPFWFFFLHDLFFSFSLSPKKKKLPKKKPLHPKPPPAGSSPSPVSSSSCFSSRC